MQKYRVRWSDLGISDNCQNESTHDLYVPKMSTSLEGVFWSTLSISSLLFNTVLGFGGSTGGAGSTGLGGAIAGLRKVHSSESALFLNSLTERTVLYFEWPRLYYFIYKLVFHVCI